MSNIVVDSSALLALFFDEAGADRVSGALADHDALITTVNVAEVTSKLLQYGWLLEHVESTLGEIPLRAVREDREFALLAGWIHGTTRQHGLAMGDAACLAAAVQEECPVLTADRRWQSLPLGVEVQLIR